MTAKSAALVIGLIFIAVGILGFIDNPIVGASPDAIFLTDKLHDWVHLGSGLLFVLIALGAPGSASVFCMFFGLVYLAIGVIGLVTVKEDGGKVFGLLPVNKADNFLHIALGVVIFVAGAAARKTPAATRY